MRLALFIAAMLFVMSAIVPGCSRSEPEPPQGTAQEDAAARQHDHAHAQEEHAHHENMHHEHADCEHCDHDHGHHKAIDVDIDADAATCQQAYPGLISGALTHARMMDLPQGVLVYSEHISISERDLDMQIATAPPEVRDDLRQNAVYLLDQLTTGRVLLHEALEAGVTGETEHDAIQTYLEALVQTAEVSDEEVAEFYQQNQEQIGHDLTENVEANIRNYLLYSKQQQMVDLYIESIGERVLLGVSEPWIRQHAKLAMDNPVDKARASGKPSFVSFGTDSCMPCQLMKPTREALREEYDGRVNVVYVKADENHVLASRYGVRNVPLLIFYNADGTEYARHEGMMSHEEVEQLLVQLQPQ